MQPLPILHSLQYGSAQPTVSQAETALKQGKRDTLLGKDIVSAFNNVRKERVLQALREHNTEQDIIDFVTNFLSSRQSDISWDGRPDKRQSPHGSGSPRPLTCHLAHRYTTNPQKTEARCADINPLILNSPLHSHNSTPTTYDPDPTL